MAKSQKESLADVVAQKKKVQEEIHIVAEDTLPKLTNDRSGTLEVTVRESRNVVPPEEDGDENGSSYGRPVKYILSIKPATVVVEEGAFSEFESTELPFKATFQVSSLEAKVVVHFGRTLEHHVTVVLANHTKENELERLSDWHTSSAGEGTETPQIQDVSDVPAVRLVFGFKRANREEMDRTVERLKLLQNQLTELSRQERGLKSSSTQVVPAGPTAVTAPSGSNRGGAGKQDASDGGPLSRYGQWMVIVFVNINKWGTAFAHGMWSKRAFIMFAGGVIFFHYRGDDCAV